MSVFFFFNDTATPEIYTLSLHDALPILGAKVVVRRSPDRQQERQSSGLSDRRVLRRAPPPPVRRSDRKSTRLNSSHANISYAVFCLKKKKKNHYGFV